ncbi:damage-inducible mutagenesis protein [Parvibaculum sp.]|uniref:ImuA family protein n=1 Tax=Parvibaculum sp. TaxID=2024848 RepID=UPI003210ABBB
MSRRSAGLIAELRARIASFEGGGNIVGESASGVMPLGAPFDQALPGGGLRRNALHEVATVNYRDMGAGVGFVAALAAQFASAQPSAPLLWCEGGRGSLDMGGLYGPGLAAFGLDPARLVLISPAREVDLLWVLEEALKLGAFAAIVGEIDGRAKALDLVATRRLQLAAEEGGTPLLLFTGHESADASVAVTRWRVAAAPSSSPPRFAGQSLGLVGRPRWNAKLERCRGAEGGATWLVEWDVGRQKFSAPDRELGDSGIRREEMLELVG